MPDAATTFFFDSVSISNFALTERLDLIQRRYSTRAVLTSEVLDEIEQGVNHGYQALRDVVRLVDGGVFQTTTLSAAERTVYRALLRNLGSGDASVIACAKLRRGIVATDDRAARTCCEDAGVSFTGTIGILKVCCLTGAIDAEQADGILEGMVRQGFYSPVRRITDLL